MSKGNKYVRIASKGNKYVRIASKGNKYVRTYREGEPQGSEPQGVWGVTGLLNKNEKHRKLFEERCLEKTSRRNVFCDLRHAKRAAHNARMRSGKNVVPFRCPVCDFFHLGKKS